MSKQLILIIIAFSIATLHCKAQTNKLFQYFTDHNGLYEDIPYGGCTYYLGEYPPPDIFFSFIKKRDTIVNAISYSLFSLSDEKDGFELWIGAKDNCMYLTESNDFSNLVEICNDSNKTPLLKTLGSHYTISLISYEYNAGTDSNDGYEEVTIELDLRLKKIGKNIFRSKKLRWLMISSQHGVFISLESGNKYYTG